MNNITSFEQADAEVKKLIPTQDNIETTVAAEPKVYDNKLFWPIVFVTADTEEPTTLFGSISYLADNGKKITFSSNPGITPFSEHERLLLAEYNK